MTAYEIAIVLGHDLGTGGAGIVAAMQAGQQFLDAHDAPALLKRVGRSVRGDPGLSSHRQVRLPGLLWRIAAGPSDDLLVGRGLFYLTERRKLYLDCTAGHYQMLWGYNHPRSVCGGRGGRHAGIVWDNHSNIPQSPLKSLARRLVAAGNAPDAADPLDTVLLGVCTGRWPAPPH